MTRMKFSIFNFQFSKRGFTIIELLIYTAILGFVFAFVIGGMLALNRAVVNGRGSRDLNTSAAVALERIVRETKDASSVDVANSILGVHPGKLVLNTSNASTTGGTMEFYISDGQIMIKQGVSTVSLTSASVQISDLVFHYISTTNSMALRVELTVESSSSPQRMFFDTAVLRESYIQ